MLELYIDTSLHNRDEVISKLQPHGKVTEKWAGGSFNFLCNTPEDVDAVNEALEVLNVEVSVV